MQISKNKTASLFIIKFINDSCIIIFIVKAYSNSVYKIMLPAKARKDS